VHHHPLFGLVCDACAEPCAETILGMYRYEKEKQPHALSLSVKVSLCRPGQSRSASVDPVPNSLPTVRRYTM